MQFKVFAIVAAAGSFAVAMPSPQASCTSSLCATTETGFTAPQPIVLGEFVECCAGTTCVTTTSETFEIAGFVVEVATGVRFLLTATRRYHTYDVVSLDLLWMSGLYEG